MMKRSICWQRFFINIGMFILLIFFSANTSIAEQEKMKITYASFLDFLMDVPIAIENGYFNQLGLDVEAIDIASGPSRNSIFLKKDINGAFFPSQTALILTDKGVALIMVCGIGNRSFDFAVLSESPIKSIKDFEGKRIANVSKSSNPRLALKYDMNKMNIKANIFSTISSADRLSMLISGKVDIILSSPSTEARLGDRIRIVHSCSTSKYLWNSCGWWFKPNYIKKHPEAVRKFIQGLAMARKLINENPAEAVRIYSKYNKLNDTSFKKPFVLPQFNNPPVIYTYGLEQTYKIMREYRMLKKEIDTSKLVDGRFAKSLVNPY